MKTIDEIINGLDDDGKKLLNSHIDSKISVAVNSFQKNHPAPDEQYKTLSARLDGIEKAKLEKEKQHAKELQAIRLCHQNGLEYDIIADILPSIDETALEQKIRQLATLSSQKNFADINFELANKSFKPNGSRIDSDRKEPFEGYSLLSNSERLLVDSGKFNHVS